MSPEYVMRGQYSIKSDVYSLGILVMEIVTGRRNNGSYLPEENEDLISIVSTLNNLRSYLIILCC
jgi:serine/threonine protein kinase